MGLWRKSGKRKQGCRCTKNAFFRQERKKKTDKRFSEVKVRVLREEYSSHHGRTGVDDYGAVALTAVETS